MSLSLDTLTEYAEKAEQMPVSAELRGQCLQFAAYLRRTKWHHSVRAEAKELADRFDKVAYSGLVPD